MKTSLGDNHKDLSKSFQQLVQQLPLRLHTSCTLPCINDHGIMHAHEYTRV